MLYSPQSAEFYGMYCSDDDSQSVVCLRRCTWERKTSSGINSISVHRDNNIKSDDVHSIIRFKTKDQIAELTTLCQKISAILHEEGAVSIEANDEDVASLVRFHYADDIYAQTVELTTQYTTQGFARWLRQWCNAIDEAIRDTGVVPDQEYGIQVSYRLSMFDLFNRA
jgi:hypothetical protein